ncbi:hypothetical protein [Pseudobacillus badius]|nr:hypothetical protein [Bacillus badius]
MSYGILSFKGTNREFKAFLQGLKQGIIMVQSPSPQSSIKVNRTT